MGTFGEELKRLRLARTWTQQQLSEHLGGQVARSTIANLEVGREQPSARVVQLLVEVFPEGREVLEDAWSRSGGRLPRQASRVAHVTDEAPIGPGLGGPFDVELFQIAYVFRHSRAPEEVVESRRVRALRSGADSFVVRISHPGCSDFATSTEPLWGGRLRGTERYVDGEKTVYLHRIDFNRRLRRGETHEFAIRHWIERDPNPPTLACTQMATPTKTLAFHLKFLDSEPPSQVWHIGPIADPAQIAVAPRTRIGTSNEITHYVRRPVTGAIYGLVWDW